MQSYIPTNRLSAGGKLGSNRPTSEVHKSWIWLCISMIQNDISTFVVSVLLASFSASDEIVNIWSILNGTLDHAVRTVLHRHSDDPQTFCAIITLNCGIVDMCKQWLKDSHVIDNGELGEKCPTRERRRECENWPKCRNAEKCEVKANQREWVWKLIRKNSEEMLKTVRQRQT